MPILRFGTNSTDNLFGTKGQLSYIYGLDGDDFLYPYAGDTVFGGNGNDTFHLGLGKNRAWGEAGNDIFHSKNLGSEIHGGSGFDTLDYSNWAPTGMKFYIYATGGTIAGSTETFDGIEKVVGTKYADKFFAYDINAYLDGHDGNDVIETGKGNDAVWGGNGNDTLWTGDGVDSIFGGFGNDNINAGKGNDNVDAGIGADIIDAGSGVNYIKLGSNGTGITGTIFDGAKDIVKIDFLTVPLIDNHIYQFEAGLAGQDVLQFNKANFANVDAIFSAMKQVGANVVIDQGYGNATTIHNATISQFDKSDFLLV